MSKNRRAASDLGRDSISDGSQPKRSVNLQGKRRDVSNPYAIYVHSGWEWRILKHYQAPKGEATNPNARVLCQVTSPYVPQGEMGDVYCREIPGYNRRRSMSEEERDQHLPKRAIAPSFNTMVDWMSMGYAEATDGCRVEPDGTCPHGCKSWLLVEGLI